MSTKSKSKQEEALKFLDDLDSLSPASPSSLPGAPAALTAAQPTNEGEAEVFAFLDEITQKSAEPTRTTSTHLERPLSRTGTPTLRKSTERVRVGTPTVSPLAPSTSLASKPDASAPAQKTPAEQQTSAQGGWGWGSVWSSASAAIQQAKSAVDEQVKYLPKNEQARKWGEGVIEYAKTAQLEKIGQDFKRVGLSTLTDILNVVAPPISEHEVIQVWLSHDMAGYDGIESLVYHALARIMEQVQGGDLIVNQGPESRPKDTGVTGRDLNIVPDYDAALKLAQAHLQELIKNNVKPTQPSSQSPTTYSQIYLRVQPFLKSHTLPSQTSADSSTSDYVPTTQSQLQFLLYLSDPVHQLVHTTVTQAVPAQWVELWDQYGWVENLIAEALRLGVQVIGQEYVVARMGWGNKPEEEPENPEARAASDEKAPTS